MNIKPFYFYLNHDSQEDKRSASAVGKNNWIQLTERLTSKTHFEKSKKAKVEMFTWDSSGCMSKESVSIVDYKRHKRPKRVNITVEDVAHHAVKHQIWFTSLKQTMISHLLP